MDKSHDAISLYDVITYAGYKWFVIKIGNDDVTLLAKNDDFGRLRFDRESSDYQNSEIRKHINSVLVNILTKNGAELETASLQGLDDKVFLLSIEEAEELPIKIRKFSEWWWLRSCGGHAYYAPYVNFDGGVDNDGYHVDFDYNAVRPAMQVHIKDLN